MGLTWPILLRLDPLKTARSIDKGEFGISQTGSYIPHLEMRQTWGNGNIRQASVLVRRFGLSMLMEHSEERSSCPFFCASRIPLAVLWWPILEPRMISPTPSMSLRGASRKAVHQEHVDARGPLRPFLFKSGLETPWIHYDEPPCADPHVARGVGGGGVGHSR